jgi:hypothetical protein
MYSPRPVPQNVNEIPAYLSNELQTIADNENSVSKHLGIEISNRAPTKPYNGQIVYADGTNWNPGSGAGLYYFNGTNWVWMSFNGVGYLTTATAASTYLTISTAASTYAPIASPALTGNPTAPTATSGDNDTTIATTAFVQSAINQSGPLAGYRNRIINGDFDIWERATSQTSNSYGSDDRWFNGNVGSTKTHSRQSFTLGQTAVPNNPHFFSRTVVTSVAGAANYVVKQQRIEDVTLLSDKTMTLSFWAKADANKNIAVEFQQYFGTGGSPSAHVTGLGVTTIALTTSWQKFTTTVTFPSVSGKTLGTNNDDSTIVQFFFDAGSSFNSRTNSLGQQSGTFDIAQVQLEEGTIATQFEYRYQQVELALCQRYFEVQSVLIGTVVNTYQGTWAVTKRIVPTLSITPSSGSGATVLAQSVRGWYQNGANSVQAATCLLTASAEL